MRGEEIVLLIIPGILLLGFFGLCLWIREQGRQEELVPAEAIVVLGAAQWNGRPSPVLQARLDRAIALYRQGYAPLLVLTGGSIAGDPFSEASAGRAYALAQGVPAEAILVEENSRSTVENLREAWKLLAPRRAYSILLVSDPFHMGRALAIARDLGFQAHPAPTPSGPIARRPLEEAFYIMREAAALLVYWVWGR
ncbi:MAG: YdcF family protein [Chloroflexia bacterium]